MSIEKYIEQDFQALETSFSRGEPLSDVALPRVLENISTLDDADRISHWHEELRRIGGLPSASETAPSVDTVEPAVATAEEIPDSSPILPELTGGEGSLST